MQLLKVMNLCKYCRAMHGIIFVGDKFTPLNKTELEKHSDLIRRGIKPDKVYHHLNEEDGTITTFKLNGRSVIEYLNAVDVNNLQIKYEIHTGFNINNLKTRVPSFFGNDNI